MEILRYRKRRWIWPGIFLLLCIFSSAWASGVDFTVSSVKRFDSITLVSNSFLTMQYGTTTAYNAVWDFSASTYGYITGTGDGIAARATAWDSTSPATGDGDASKHYGYLSATSTPAGDPSANVNAPIIAKWRAYKPFNPEIYQIVESKTTSYPSRAVSGDLTVKVRQQLPGTGEDAEVTACLWRYWKNTETPTETSTTGDLVIRGATGPATYHFQVALDNQWGTPTSYSSILDYEFGGPGGGAVSVPYSLKKAEGGLGLNAVAALPRIPFNVEGAAVSKIGELVTAINTKSGANNTVATIGWMEDGSADIKGWYITYDTAGTATYTPTGGLTTGADTALVPNKIYQISVMKNVDVTFSQ
jgi:hypothetical protein